MQDSSSDLSSCLGFVFLVLIVWWLRRWPIIIDFHLRGGLDLYIHTYLWYSHLYVTRARVHKNGRKKRKNCHMLILMASICANSRTFRSCLAHLPHLPRLCLHL